MSSPLHQLTMTYSPEQDRVLLRIATREKTEYQLWMTRRFVRVMCGALIQTMEKNPEMAADLLPDVKDAVLAMEHQESIQSSDFSQSHSEETTNLTSNTGPLLVTGGNVKTVNPDLTRINLKTDNGMNIEFGLNKQLLHALCHMMITSAQKADWDLELAVGDPQVVVPESSGVVH
ncbi:MAG: hypothetical protein HN877_18985 [Rhodospirillaceae bacterium]|nr:hypothetical protein [Rhodospirillaceae bacterium]